MNLPYISVIIPCYNCAATIQEVLLALMRQDYAGAMEIVCVDDGSQDETAALIQEFKDVRYLHQENAGPAQARNVGAGRAQGDVLVFTDSDCIAEVNWLSCLVQGFTSEEVGAVAGSYGIANPHSCLARGVHQEILFRHHHLMREYVRAFGSYNMAIKKKIFSSLGGFDGGYRRASGEDNDLSYRVVQLGYKIAFRRDALVNHFHPTSVVKYFREQFQHGYWRVKLYQKHPRMAGGDDYTFWKDILEVPIVFGIVGVGLLVFFLAPKMNAIFFQGVLFFLLFEIIFGYLFTQKITDGVFFGLVMAGRSFARVLGFCTGAISFLLTKT